MFAKTYTPNQESRCIKHFLNARDLTEEGRRRLYHRSLRGYLTALKDERALTSICYNPALTPLKTWSLLANLSPQWFNDTGRRRQWMLTWLYSTSTRWLVISQLRAKHNFCVEAKYTNTCRKSFAGGGLMASQQQWLLM